MKKYGTKIKLKFWKRWGMLFLFLLMSPAFSQAQFSKDTAQINALLVAVRNTMDTSTAKAFIILNQLKQLCTRAKADTLTAKVFTEEGYCNFYSGNYQTAAEAFDSAALLWKNKNKLNYLKSLNNVGTAFMYHSEYSKALSVFFEALKGSENTGNIKLSGQVLNNIGLVYESLGDYDNALLYGKKAMVYKLKAKDSLALANSYGNIGNIFSFKQEADSAIAYQWQSHHIDFLINNKAGMSNALGNIGNAYMQKKNFDSAIVYLIKAIGISQTLGNAENNANFLTHLGECYLQKNDLANARKYALQSNTYVSAITDNEFLQDNYRLMYGYYKKKGNTSRAFHYLEKLASVNDSIFKQKINIQNEKLATAYEYKQKNLQDSLLFQSQVNESERKVVAGHHRFIVSLLFLLLAAALATIWYNRSKLLQKKNIVAEQNVALQEQKIRELENEKQILASQAVLKGQEEERSRLARDLHDGLGGLLSGVKHSIINMKEGVIISNSNASVFEKSLIMIDTAMKELRRVAQNMMPEALAKFGLEEALKDYCAAACTSSVKVVFQSFGGKIKLDSPSEIIIYRIIQELVNNAVKHSHAMQVMVQLVAGDDWITISVEDNGVGFETGQLKKSAGSGWSNIRSRVEYLKGDIDLKSQSGVGTSVNIEIKKPKQ